ncbi:MAG: helix-turn-helix domain-containing protein [Halobacteriota archaeon]
MSQQTPSGDISPRDIVILKARVANPTASSRELSDILAETHDIELSHNRINEILRDMSERDVFRETIIPDERIFRHYLFRVAFYYPNFEDNWEDCYWDIVDDPHVLMFFNADSHYHWQIIAQFRTDEQQQKWVHQLFKKHGDVFAQFHTTMLHTVHKFQTDAAVFDDMLSETPAGMQYLEGGE